MNDFRDVLQSLPQQSVAIASLNRNLLTRLLIGGTTLIVSLAAYGSYQVVRNLTLENLKRSAFLEVRRGTDEIDSWLALRKAEVQMFANTDAVSSLDWATAEPYLKAEAKRINEYLTLSLANPDGSYYNTLLGRTNKKLSNRTYFQRALAGNLTVSDPFIGQTNKVASIAIATPIRQTVDASRPPIGVFIGVSTIARVSQVVSQLHYGEGSYAFALNSTGEAIVHPNAALMSTAEKPAPSLLEAADRSLAAIAQRMVDKKQGIELVDIDGTQKYLAFMPLEEANWSVALVIPHENLEAQLRPLNLMAIVVAGLAVTMIVVLWQVQSFEQAQLRKSKIAADEAKEAANAANQAKSDFLASMSHELRTPLNGILGYAQILGRSKVIPEKERHGVNIIHQCGSHLLTLINDVLDLSKIEARKLELSPKAIHLPSFLQGVVEICRVRSDQKGLDFIYQPDPNLPTGIETDEKRLRQVLLNLLGNAIKFTDQGSITLKVETRESNANMPLPRLKFQVIDTGVGIASDEVNKLFQAFEQLGERKRQSEGTGLGLAISQRIVQLMGGKIQVESQLGVGSTFYFEVALPIATDWAEKSSVKDGRTIIGYEGALRHILIVDDRWENRSVLVNLLEPIGFTFTEAENGQTGLEKAREKLPDLVITDLAMPIMNGFEMLKQLRNSQELKRLKVLVSSASVAQIDRQMSIEAGGDDFLTKPVDAEELLTLVAKHLQLTWKYDTTELSTSDNTVSATELIPPSAVDLQILLELAQDGLLREVAETAAEIGQKDERYQPFIQEVIQLAKQFQTEKIEQLIEEYLTDT
ncbi:MAG: ATP-binding protein [Actinomycetota bacterium]